MRKKFIYVLWALLILGILSVAAVFTAIAKGWIGYVPPVEELENPNLKFATQIISDDGQLLGTWSYSKENRVYVVTMTCHLIWFMHSLQQKMFVSVNILV